MSITIKRLSVQDINVFSQLIDVFEEVFEMKDFIKPEAHYLHDILSKPNFLAVVAFNEDRVVGGLTVYTLDQYYSKQPLAYIYDLAVLKAYQRQGIGQALVKFTTDHCREKGYAEVFVQADRVDDYALDFYRKTKPTQEEDVVHFYYTL